MIKKSAAVLIVGLTSFCFMIACGKGSVKENDLMDSIDQIQGLEDYEPSSELLISYSNDITYQVSDIVWDGDTGIATVKVTAPDLEKIISDSIAKGIEVCGTENYTELLEQTKLNVFNMIESEQCPMTSESIQMDTVKDGDGYVLIHNDEFEEIINGNVEKIFMNMLIGGN